MSEHAAICVCGHLLLNHQNERGAKQRCSECDCSGFRDRRHDVIDPADPAPDDGLVVDDYLALHVELFPDLLSATHAQRIEALRSLARAFNEQRATIAELRAVLRRELAR